MSTEHPSTADDDAKELAIAAARAAADKKAHDVKLLDLSGLLVICDWFVICSGTTDRQLRTIVDEVEDQVRLNLQRKPRRREGDLEAGWIVLDFGDVVVHAFTDAQREHYNLERLWADAPTLEVLDGPEFVVSAVAGGAAAEDA